MIRVIEVLFGTGTANVFRNGGRLVASVLNYAFGWDLREGGQISLQAAANSIAEIEENINQLERAVGEALGGRKDLEGELYRLSNDFEIAARNALTPGIEEQLALAYAMEAQSLERAITTAQSNLAQIDKNIESYRQALRDQQLNHRNLLVQQRISQSEAKQAEIAAKFSKLSTQLDPSRINSAAANVATAHQAINSRLNREQAVVELQQGSIGRQMNQISSGNSASGYLEQLRQRQLEGK